MAKSPTEEETKFKAMHYTIYSGTYVYVTGGHIELYPGDHGESYQN